MSVREETRKAWEWNEIRERWVLRRPGPGAGCWVGEREIRIETLVAYAGSARVDLGTDAS